MDKIAGIVMVILAATLAVSVVGYIAYILIYDKTLQPPASTTFATATGGIIGILAAFLGSKRRNGGDK